MECPHCFTPVAPRARFCPRCGKSVAPEPDAGGAAREDVPRPEAAAPPPRLRAPFPWAGVLFLTGAVLGPAGVICGIWWGSNPLLYAGITISAAVLLVVLVGMLF